MRNILAFKRRIDSPWYFVYLLDIGTEAPSKENHCRPLSIVPHDVSTCPVSTLRSNNARTAPVGPFYHVVELGISRGTMIPAFSVFLI